VVGPDASDDELKAAARAEYEAELARTLEPAVVALVRFLHVYRRVLAVMAREHRIATTEERDEVLYLLEVAWAHHRVNREEPGGWRVEDLPEPPTAQHVAAVYRLLPSKHRLPLLWLDWSGARVGSIDRTLASDYDEPRRRVRLRATTTKTKRPLWVELPDVLAEALEARLGSREDRDPDARLFGDSGADALRTSIAKACTAAGIPLFSPHDLRHLRISLLHLRGMPWVRIGEFVGQRSLSVTADTYTHVLTDETEVDYEELLNCARA
jgi:integrase